MKKVNFYHAFVFSLALAASFAPVAGAQPRDLAGKTLGITGSLCRYGGEQRFFLYTQSVRVFDVTSNRPDILNQLASISTGLPACPSVELHGKFTGTNDGQVVFEVDAIEDAKIKADPPGVYVVSGIWAFPGDASQAGQSAARKYVEEKLQTEGLAKVSFVSQARSLDGLVAVVSTAYSLQELKARLRALNIGPLTVDRLNLQIDGAHRLSIVLK